MRLGATHNNLPKYTIILRLHINCRLVRLLEYG